MNGKTAKYVCNNVCSMCESACAYSHDIQSIIFQCLIGFFITVNMYYIVSQKRLSQVTQI